MWVLRRGVNGSPPYARRTIFTFKGASHASLRGSPRTHGDNGRNRRTTAIPAVHPRTHGDNLDCAVRPNHVHGSPPYARGQWPRRLRGPMEVTVHPRTHGDNHAGAASDRRRPVHPVRTGDNQSGVRLSPVDRGSPPYARGQCRRSETGNANDRFTPVRTGTMPGGSTRIKTCTVHPRTHGDNRYSDDAISNADGSPPYARGQCSLSSHSDLRQRFTPVRTGTIQAEGGAGFRHRFTPVRTGQWCPDRSACKRFRFTPVRTGTMTKVAEYDSVETVHPRTHGDNRAAATWRNSSNGSPPYARGQ